MSEGTTDNLPDAHSFEDRVFARFDAIDSRLDGVESRLSALESQAERRALETRPIWERALAGIGEVKSEIVEVKERLTSLEHLSHQMVRKIDVLSRDMLTLRADQAGLEDRLDKLDSEPAKS
ncbi:MAG: hypothetical protein QOJ64_678 [Acidobacteriota bacterium]|jgi:chromosome segregation ATPase|nr:hypothetical protein [Acidobacteriota bacterium]